MSNFQTPKRHDTSMGKLFIRRPTHSTPVKEAGSEAVSHPYSNRGSTQKPASQRKATKASSPAINSLVASNHRASNMSSCKSDDPCSSPAPANFTVTSTSPCIPRSQRSIQLEFFSDALNLSDTELSYRDHRSEVLNQSSPLPLDSFSGKSLTLASVRKNLTGALGLNDSKSQGHQKFTSGYESMELSDQASLHQAKLTDFENQTIQKQRQELALMIAELRDRDRELNDMVSSHQKQLAAWEQDRKKLLTLEEKCAKLERDIHSKNDELRSVKAKLRVVECEDMDKSAALNNTQEQLLVMSEQQSQTSLRIQDLEQRNKSLASSLKEMSHSLGQLEAREQELLTVLQLKDRDLSDASCHLAELSARLKKMELHYKEAKSDAAENQKKISEWKNKYLNQERELDYTKKVLNRSEQRCDEQHVEILRLRQEVSTLKKELTLAGEREKRKDQLLDLHKSRQERTDAELTSLRQLYERQQRDLTLLHLNLENTKELLQRHQIDFPGMGSVGFTTGHSPFRSRTFRDSFRNKQDFLSDSYIETTSYIPPDNDGLDNANSIDFGKDSDFEVERPSTPPENKRLAAARQTSVKETDSPATKLHKLLTESKVMVEELEKSNQSTPRQISQQSTPKKDEETDTKDTIKDDVDHDEEQESTGSFESEREG